MTVYRHETSVHGFVFLFTISKLPGNHHRLGSAIYGPQAKSSQLSVFTVLLEHSYIHRCFHATVAELGSCDNCIVYKAKMFFTWPFT